MICNAISIIVMHVLPNYMHNVSLFETMKDISIHVSVTSCDLSLDKKNQSRCVKFHSIIESIAVCDVSLK